MNCRGFLVIPILVLAVLAAAQFTPVTGTASDFVPEEQVKVDAQLEKEGRLILTKAISRVPLDANQKVELKRIFNGRTQTEKQFREVHKVPNATIRAFNLEQTRLAINAIHQMLTEDQWHLFCEAQVASEEHEVVVEPETGVVSGGPVKPTVQALGVVVVEHRHHAHKEVKVIVVKAERVRKARLTHVKAVHPAHVSHPPVRHSPVHRAR